MRDCSQYSPWRFRPYSKENPAASLDYVACQFDDPANPHVQIPDQFIEAIAKRYPNAINLGSQAHEGFVSGIDLTPSEKLEIIKAAKLYIGIDCDLTHLAGTTNSLCVVVHPTTQRPHFCFPTMSQYRFFSSIEQFDSLMPLNGFERAMKIFAERQGKTIVEIGNRPLPNGIESTRVFAEHANVVCTLHGDSGAVERARFVSDTFNNVFIFQAPMSDVARLAVPIDLMYFGEHGNYDSHVEIFVSARKRLSGRSMLLIEDAEMHSSLIERAKQEGYRLIYNDEDAFLVRTNFLRLKLRHGLGM